ncbi:uncharacterized protein LOC115208544 isoform X3 [Salmo trutta]|uniref:uncharacterized protein LOC115208544 isoform X3 n=1 Tax=Salmo trutta TaxID=8032 RepID=UPI00112FF05C|nr:uncharacterized protein LOC115208544 isoform X3 [Salmo trutta]
MSSQSFSPAAKKEVCWTEKEPLGLNIVVKEEEGDTVKGEEDAFRTMKEKGETITLKEEEGVVMVNEEKGPFVVKEEVDEFRMKEETITLKEEEEYCIVKEEEIAISIKEEEDVLELKEEEGEETEDTKPRQNAVFWPSQGCIVKEDIRKIQGEYSVAPVSASQTVDNDDNALHCNEEWDMEDKDWFPSNRLEDTSFPPPSHFLESSGRASLWGLKRVSVRLVDCRKTPGLSETVREGDEKGDSDSMSSEICNLVTAS